MSPATCVFSTVSPGCLRPQLLSLVLCGVTFLPVMKILLSGFGIFTSLCLQRTVLYIVFQARTLHQPCVAAVCVSCHSVHTNLFKVPCGCFTCKNFLLPSVMCPQCRVSSSSLLQYSHSHSASLKTSPWAKVTPQCPSTGDTANCHLWSASLY